jgi:hypothetical protein
MSKSVQTALAHGRLVPQRLAADRATLALGWRRPKQATLDCVTDKLPVGGMDHGNVIRVKHHPLAPTHHATLT